MGILVANLFLNYKNFTLFWIMSNGIMFLRMHAPVIISCLVIELLWQYYKHHAYPLFLLHGGDSSCETISAYHGNSEHTSSAFRLHIDKTITFFVHINILTCHAIQIF